MIREYFSKKLGWLFEKLPSAENPGKAASLEQHCGESLKKHRAHLDELEGQLRRAHLDCDHSAAERLKVSVDRLRWKVGRLRGKYF